MADTPLYRIQVVSAITGVSAATLRAWERRYGFPKPERANNAYRLYSESDVRSIQHMSRLCAQGTLPSDAAAIVKADLDGGPAPSSTDAHAQLVDELVEAAHRFDDGALRRTLDRALTTGSALDVYQRVLLPTLDLLFGEEGRKTAERHFASQAVLSAARNLVRLVQPAASAHRALLACVEHDADELPLYGLALAAAQHGWRSVVVGARTPPSAIVAARAVVTPDAIGLSVSGTSEGVDLPAYSRAHAGLPWFVWGLEDAAEDGLVNHGGHRIARLEALEHFLRRVDGGRPFKAPAR